MAAEFIDDDGLVKMRVILEPGNGIAAVQGEQGTPGPQGIPGPQGEQGQQGDRGDGFEIAVVYPSIAAMNADATNVAYKNGEFALINSSDADNGKLYVKHNNAYLFQSQLAGVKGEKGNKGDQGVQGLQGIQGIAGQQGIRGEKGEQGVAGLPGKDGTTISTTTGEATISAGFSNVGGVLDVKFTKQGIFTKAELRVVNGSSHSQPANTLFNIGTIPVGFRPATRSAYASTKDNTASTDFRHDFIFGTDGNISWIPRVTATYWTMVLTIVY